MRPVRLQEVEPGQRYLFTFRRPVLAGSRKRTLVATVGAAFWGEVPLEIGRGRVIRVERSDVLRALHVA